MVRSGVGFLVTVGIGLVNTTLHSETGILATLLIGAWIGYRHRAGPRAHTEVTAPSVASAEELKSREPGHPVNGVEPAAIARLSFRHR